MKANQNPYPYAPHLGMAAGAVRGPRSMPKTQPQFSPEGGNPIRNMSMRSLATKLNSATSLSPQAAKEILNDSHLKLGGLLSGALQSVASRAE